MHKKPSKRTARGYDILVWVDREGDIVATNYSPRGLVALKRIVPEYADGDILEIFINPDEFAQRMTDVKVGYVNWNTGRAGPLPGENPLH